MNKTLFEFSVRDRRNIPRKKLLTIVQEEIAVEANQKNWCCDYEIIETHVPARQIDGTLVYTFRVVSL